jgi:hypothetical protein
VNERELVERAQAGLAAAGVDDVVSAAAVFLPRGHFAGAFAGGLAGDAVGGGGVGSSIGTGIGAAAGMRAADAASGLPDRTIVAVTGRRVYGFATERSQGGRRPTDLIFAVDRGTLEVNVHGRVNVRVLELIDGPSGDAIELEGPRLPGFHAGAVIDALTSS